MKKRVILDSLITSFLFAVNTAYSSVVVTNAMENPLWGYEVHGIGDKANEIAVVFTNHTETATWTVPDDIENIQFLVVGGGGGGGGDYGTDDGRYGGGGGGGGGVVAGTIVSIKKDAVVSVKVGAGGKGGVAGGKPGTSSYNYNGAAIKGGNSEFSIDGVQYVVADGGGRDLGAKSSSTVYAGGGGGSSAGSRAQKTSQGNNTKGEIKVSSGLATGTAHGCKGGAGDANIKYAAGGGGGATVDGKSPADSNHGGNGGEGLESTITGKLMVYGSGGGGGTATSAGVGGKGGTGAGDGHLKSNSNGENALANQGGGGGGSGGKSNGGNGGSGIVVFRYVMPHVHEWGEWTTNKVATCTENGMRVRTCSVEGCEVNEVIPALGHDWGEWNVLREQERATPGRREHTCRRCGEYEKVLFVNRPIRILSIGNSFSTLMCEKNALPKAAALIGCPVDYAHLYKGGATLSTAYSSLNKTDVYYLKSSFASDEVPLAGFPSYPKIADVLKAYDWDIVTLQQGSMSSYRESTYDPHFDNLVAKVREYAPNAKIVWQMTWSYGRFAKKSGDGASVDFKGNVAKRDQMFDNILNAYNKHVKDVVWKTIPTGYAIQLYRYRLPVIEPKQDFTYGDYQHLADEDATEGNTGGEYLQTLTWCKALFGEMPSYEAYPPSAYSGAYNLSDSDEEEIMRLRQCASDACDATSYDYYGQGTVDFHWNVKFLNNDGSLISQQSITNGATAKVLKIFNDKSWSCKRRVRASGDGVTTETVTMTSENISTNKVYDTLTFTAKEAITDLGPQVAGESYDPEDAVNAARESKSVQYPSLPTLSGEVGSQVVTFGEVVSAVPSYYTASLDGNELSLKLNDAAKPVIDDEDEAKAFEIKDGKVSIHLTNVKNKLYYSIISAQTPNADDADWEVCSEYEVGKSDFEIETNGEKRFYKASVKDEL